MGKLTDGTKHPTWCGCGKDKWCPVLPPRATDYRHARWRHPLANVRLHAGILYSTTGPREADVSMDICGNGHSLTGSGLAFDKQGRRRCRTCQELHQQRKLAKAKAKLDELRGKVE